MASRMKPYRIIQITDPHLGGSRDQVMLGINSFQSFELVVDLVKQEQGQEFDRILSSGDISFDQSEQSYRDFIELVEPFGRPISWLPGNHDNPAVMSGITDVPLLEHNRVVDLGDWQLILLNTNTPGEIGGELQPSELELLSSALKGANGKLSMISMHHHPVSVGCDWMDPQQLANASCFFDIIRQYPGAEVLLWGHVHQEFDDQQNNLRLLATPSTCHQFEPNQQQFMIGTQLPGYRWIDLYPNGRIETGVSRIKSTPFEIDYRSKGY